MSETGSLDRMKAAAERRKKGLDEGGPTVSGRVEGTRVNPDSLIDEILKNTKLDQLEESAESKKLFAAIENVEMKKLMENLFAFIFSSTKLLDCNYTLLEMVRLLLAKVPKLNLECQVVSSNKLLWIIQDSSYRMCACGWMCVLECKIVWCVRAFYF